MIDIPAYLNRINYNGSTQPTVETLRALHRAHLLTVPFENLDIRLNRHIVLDEAALFEKIVVNRRGGFCYELNGLFASLLRQLGFDVTIFSANVLHGGIPAEIDHLSLLIQLDERWIADVGFGDSSRLPLRLDEEGEQFGVDSTYRITRPNDRWLLQRLVEKDEWYDEYTFRLDSLEMSDFQGACEYYQTAPESYFVQGRICSRAMEDGRISLTDDKLIVTRNGQREETPIAGEQDFVRALSEHFGIQIRRFPMNLNSIWSALEDIYDTLGGYGFAAMDKAATEMELKPDWSTWLFAVWLFGSEPITTANFMRIFPYGLASHNEERFASAVQHGYLMSNGKNGYTPTEFGMKAAHKVWRAAGDSLAALKPMPEAQMEKAFGYLARLGDAALSSPEPPSHYFMAHKRENYQNFEVVNPLERFIVLFGELSAYRDDMYTATWSAQRVDGHAWEALDLLSQSESMTFDELHEKTSRRGVTREAHAEDVQDLIGRGWVDDALGKIQITSKGKQVRAEVEAETERLFFAPWSCLNESELEELSSLASQLRNGLRSSIN